MLEWNEDKPVGSYLLKPHAGSLIAFEAMSGWGAQGQVPATIDDLGRLDAIVVGLEDPILSGPVLGGTDDLMVRVSYQQFPYGRHPSMTRARMRPMFERSLSSDKFQLINKALVDELLGADVETYTDLAPFFLAAVMSNEGKFDPHGSSRRTSRLSMRCFLPVMLSKCST